MCTDTVTGTSHFRSRPACACRRCRAQRARRTPRIVESTLVVASCPMTSRWRQRNRWYLSCVALLLLLALLLFTGMATLWDSGPLSPLLFRPTATVTIVPTRLDRLATLVINAVTGTPDAARHEIEARFVSATSPVQKASGQATGIAHVPAIPAWGNVTFYNAATYPQTIAAGTVLTGADGVRVVTDNLAPIPAGNPPLFSVVTVSAHAALAGSRGNIAALDVDALCCVAGVAVKNTTGFTGGQDAQTYTMVRQADLDGLARPLIDTLTQRALAEAQSQLRPYEWMVTIPACIPATGVDHPVGSRTTRLTVIVSVTCRGEVYDQRAAMRLAAISFAQEVITTLGANYTLMSRVTTTLTGVAVIDTKRGALALSILAGGVWVYRWRQVPLEAMKKLIAGARKQEALALLLRQEGVQAASIFISGSERTILPADPGRILITVAGEPTAAGGGIQML